jgi:hypothetical protein
MKRSLLAIVLSLSALAGGCGPKTVTGTPPGVSSTTVQNWDSAVANLNKIASAVSAMRQAVIGLNKTVGSDGTPVFPDGPAYTVTLQALGRIAQVELDAANFLNGVPQDWSQPTQQKIVSYMNDIIAQITALNQQGVTGIKNLSTQTQITQLLSELSDAANLILSLKAS